MKRLIILFLSLLSATSLMAQGGNDKFKLQAQADIGTLFLDDAAGPTVTLGIGVRMFGHLYVGVETGFDTMIKRYRFDSNFVTLQHTRFEGYIPVGANLKGYLFKNHNWSPYLNCSLGGFFGFYREHWFEGFRSQIGLGIDIKQFNVNVGYHALVHDVTQHCGYVKLGYRF